MYDNVISVSVDNNIERVKLNEDKNDIEIIYLDGIISVKVSDEKIEFNINNYLE